MLARRLARLARLVNLTPLGCVPPAAAASVPASAAGARMGAFSSRAGYAARAGRLVQLSPESGRVDGPAVAQVVVVLGAGWALLVHMDGKFETLGTSIEGVRTSLDNKIDTLSAKLETRDVKVAEVQGATGVLKESVGVLLGAVVGQQQQQRGPSPPAGDAATLSQVCWERLVYSEPAFWRSLRLGSIPPGDLARVADMVESVRGTSIRPASLTASLLALAPSKLQEVSVRLEGTPDKEVLQTLARFPRLTRLRLHVPHLPRGAATERAFEALCSLRSLAISAHELPARLVYGLLQLTNLTALELASPFPLWHAHLLELHPALQSLQLSSNYVQPAPMPCPANFSALRRYKLRNAGGIRLNGGMTLHAASYDADGGSLTINYAQDMLPLAAPLLLLLPLEEPGSPDDPASAHPGTVEDPPRLPLRHLSIIGAQHAEQAACVADISVHLAALAALELHYCGGGQALLQALLPLAPCLADVAVVSSLRGALPPALLALTSLTTLCVIGTNGLSDGLPEGPYLAGLRELAFWDRFSDGLPPALMAATSLMRLKLDVSWDSLGDDVHHILSHMQQLRLVSLGASHCTEAAVGHLNWHRQQQREEQQQEQQQQEQQQQAGDEVVVDGERWWRILAEQEGEGMGVFAGSDAESAFGDSDDNGDSKEE